ncbi:MAG TPA: P1 family peptidase [Terriglobia bacterium]|nr:P1 family peptidase [Terriglobia bacterium]
MQRLIAIATVLLALAYPALAQEGSSKPQLRTRARDLGIKIGGYEPGPLNAITDVAGVRVGQVTVIQGENVRTGVTAIVPHEGNMFQDKVAAAVYVYNAFGKLVGSTQVNELGQLETPILLTNTLSVWDAAAALVDWMLALPGNQEVRSVNPVVGETNDGWLDDIRGRHVKANDVVRALESAHGGPVEEGSVGAGTGTVALGWKGGIGTSSRRLSPERGEFTVGVIVQSNFGGHFTLDGVPVWRELSGMKPDTVAGATPHESCMMVVATDAPLESRQLRRLAKRAILGLARTGSFGENGSGDYVIAFSTTSRFPAQHSTATSGGPSRLSEDQLSPLFEATIEATEEAIDDSVLGATTIRGRDGHVAEAIPIDKLRQVMKKYGR